MRCNHYKSCTNSYWPYYMDEMINPLLGKNYCHVYCLDYEIEQQQVVYHRMNVTERNELLKTISGLRMKLEAYIDKTVKPIKKFKEYD